MMYEHQNEWNMNENLFLLWFIILTIIVIYKY